MLSSVYAQSLALPASQGQRRPRHATTAAAASGSLNSSAGCSEAAAPSVQHVPAPQTVLQRRQLLSLLPPAAAVLLGAAGPAAAAEEPAAAAAGGAATQATTYLDAEDKFSITIPAGWEQGEGAIGDAGTLTSQQARFSNAAGLRRVVAFVPHGKPDVSVAVTIQFISADFTAMGSFGTAGTFASGVVNKMDNSYLLRVPEWQRGREGPVQVAKLLDAREVERGAKQYVFSYSLAKEGEPGRTVYQAVAIGNNGRYNRLFTVNASCTADDLAQYGPVLQRIVDSFTPPPAAA